MSRHRLVIVGCGGMAKAHASRFKAILDRVQIVAAVDVVPERAKAVADLLPGCRWVTDYREVIKDCDATLLVLPHQLHHPVGIDFLKAGKHVLMEKPLANSEKECLDLIRTARKMNRILMVAYVMRYHPLVLKFKELLDAKAMGKVFQVSIWTEQYTHYPPGHWGLSAATLGGGQLFSHGCHYVDLLLWMLGHPAEGVHMGSNYGTEWMEREGTSNLSMRFESGVMGYHFGTWGAKGTRLGYTLQAHCTEGMIDADIRAGTLKTIKNKVVTDILSVEQEKKHTNKPTEREMDHFIDCIEGAKVPETDAAPSLQSLRVIWRLYEAEERKKLADLRGLGLDQVKEDGSLIAVKGQAAKRKKK